MTSLPQIRPIPSLQRTREALLWLAILLACGVGLTNNSTDPDLWGHVQYGRDVLRDGLLHPTATYTYTAVGHHWINHENLSELLFALGMDTIGPTAMLWGKLALGLGVFAWFMRRESVRGAKPIAICMVFLLASLNLMHFWLIRPQLLSYVCFAAMLAVLQYAFAGWEGEWRLSRVRKAATGTDLPVDGAPETPLAWSRLHYLWLLVPIQLIWTNAHGAFIAGGCILAAYLLCRTLEMIVSFGRRGASQASYLLLILGTTLASTLINPYGWDLHIKLFHKLVVPRPEIIEWAPPELFSVVWVQFWVLLALWGVSFALAKKRGDFTQLVIVTLVAWQAIEHRRHIAFLALLSLAWLTPLVMSLLSRLQPKSTTDESPQAISGWQSCLQMGSCALVILLAVGLFFDQLRMLPVPRNRYPVDAFEFMADRGLTREGKLVVQFEWAQYAILAFGQREPNTPGLRVAFDGRFRTCYPQEVLDMYWDFDMGETPAGTRYRSPKSPHVDGSRILDVGDPDLVLAGRHRPNELKVLEANTSQWTLLYQDQLAQIWGRRDKFDNPHHPHYLPPERRSISEKSCAGLVPWPAVPQS